MVSQAQRSLHRGCSRSAVLTEDVAGDEVVTFPDGSMLLRRAGGGVVVVDSEQVRELLARQRASYARAVEQFDHAQRQAAAAVRVAVRAGGSVEQAAAAVGVPFVTAYRWVAGAARG